ncbi:unnamed protein product [Ascophyllum nodosum]
MVELVVKERGGRVCAMNHRGGTQPYCIDNGAMVAQAGVFQYMHTGGVLEFGATCTYRVWADAVDVLWSSP